MNIRYTFRILHTFNLRLHTSNEITHDRLVEAVKLAHELLGAETVVLMTIPFTNNVLTAEEMNIVNHINEDIREIAQGWHLRKSTGAASRMHVLVLEYGAYIDHITWSNARNLGYNVSAPLMMTKEAFDAEGPTFLYDKLETGKNWKPTIAMVCSELNWLGTEKAECKRNYLIRDGKYILLFVFFLMVLDLLTVIKNFAILTRLALLRSCNVLLISQECTFVPRHWLLVMELPWHVYLDASTIVNLAMVISISSDLTKTNFEHANESAMNNLCQ